MTDGVTQRCAAAAERSLEFAAAATRASVSRQFLDANADLRAEIERLRNEPPPAPVRLPVRERASEESIRTRLRAALDENKRLRDEVAELRDELAPAHGRVHERQLAVRTANQVPASRPAALSAS